MRTARIHLLASLVLICLASTTWAQYGRMAGADCGCGQPAPCPQTSCCPPLLPTLAAGVHHVLGSLLPCACSRCCGPIEPTCGVAARMGGRTSCCPPLLPLFSRRFHSPCGVPCNDCENGQWSDGPVLESESIMGEESTTPTPAVRGQSPQVIDPPKPETSARMDLRRPGPSSRGGLASDRSEPYVRSANSMVSHTTPPGRFVPNGARSLKTVPSPVRAASAQEPARGIPVNPLRR